jgi:hypothetical protein
VSGQILFLNIFGAVYIYIHMYRDQEIREKICSYYLAKNSD